ncbi:anoctamin-6 isoform X4 [Zeugodacus cucurbitae]|uniref:anoctamin-6 isoform X4 n=1 Tax=Zeugodacus cucurbitae TaxID=28588 RepID=UPI0023D8F9B3|nr:anoctamin-6 isoform X4 [Zeugodacus cucurbitae]
MNPQSMRTNDFVEYPESEMDDLESLYFDTISLADSEAAAAVAAAHRKSLSQSRNTIYHSAVDLAGEDTPSKRRSLRSENGSSRSNSSAATAAAAAAAAMNNPNSRLPYNLNYRHSSALEHYNNSANNANGNNANAGVADQTDAAIAAQVMAMHNGRTHAYGNSLSHSHSNSAGGGGGGSKSNSTPHLNADETRRRFQDGKRSVDFVLAYIGDDDYIPENRRKREIFETNLIKEGLHLEHDNTQRIHFIKIHAPLEVLCRYAEILKIKLPMKKIPGQELIEEDDFRIKDCLTTACSRFFSWLKVSPERPYRIHFEFSRNYEHLFDWEQPNFFDAGVRNSIINFILERQNFVEGEETPDNLGIEKLLEDRVYHSAYPLHDDTDRDFLLQEWATLRKWIHLQPLDSIKEYFGAKVALYFAWLGFYTHMLIPVSVLGILCFVYGFVTWNSDPISRQICNDNQTTLMCPQCDRNCDFWLLEKTCNSSKMNYLIDNNITVVFASIMALWAVFYLELWKRYSATLVHRWGLTTFSQHVEHPRPQYLSKLQKHKDITERWKKSHNILEPDVPFWRIKFLPSFTSYSIMVLFICVSLIAIFSMIVYRMAQKASHSILGSDNSMTYKIMVLPMTAGIIDLIVISMLDYVYTSLAVYLTNMEYCRTQTEYDESLTVKNYIFQFVNYYSSLFYIAFLKGKFVGYPAKYNRILGFRQEECNPGGCLMELCMQLVIIMVGKQAVNAIVEMFFPYIMRCIRKLSARMGMRKVESEEKLISCNQWTEDYHLEPSNTNSLFSEYLEMVLQFGFITLFGLAFPLAPLLALINNVIEVRLDAIKMLKLIRRPVAQRASNIGVWYNMMAIVARIAVASSAMIIAFSTNLIPKLVYTTATNDASLEGYLNFTLAYFNTEDFQVQPVLHGSIYENATSCRYTEFRNAPWDDNPYKRPTYYWKILTGRLAFIVVFQNVIGVIQGIIAWAIADEPSKLRKRIKREGFLLREHIIEYEKKTAAEKAAARRAIDEAQYEDEKLPNSMDYYGSNKESASQPQRNGDYGDNDPTVVYRNERTTPL